tara:strand:+ start:17624 stop:19714 length:2091 start_codon:yes stop_codon:yes gene_type:complete
MVTRVCGHLRHTLLAVGVLAFTGMAVSVSAQEVENIERIVTTGSRIVSDNQNAPYPITSISQQQIEQLSPQHIQQALNYVAGAGVQRGNGQEYLPALRSPVLTGAGACGGILAAEDGIPLRAAGFCNINELFEAHSEMAQRIDVVKGPSSLLYGSNAIHGVINVITPDTTQGGGWLGADYGSYGYARIKVRNGKDFGDSGIGVNASITDDSGYRNGEGVKQEKVNVRYRTALEKGTLTSGLTYTHLDQDTAGYITGFESYEDPLLIKTNPNPEAFRKAQSFRGWVKLDVQVNQQLALSITPYVRHQDMDFRMHFLPGTPLEENDQKGAGLLSQLRYQLTPNLYLNSGVDTEYTRGGLVQSQDTQTEGSDFLVETVPVGKHYDYDVTAFMLAPFAALEWQTAKWNVSLGGRYERLAYDYTNNMIDGRTRDDGTECGFGGCRYSRPESGENNFTEFSPKFTLSYSPQDNLQWYLDVAKGYRAPQATELYRLQRDQEVADLDSVSAVSAQVGLRTGFNNGSLDIAVYRLRKENVIYRDSDFFNVNNGKTLHKGVEVTLSYQLLPQWAIDVAGTYARHTYEHSQQVGEVDIQGNDMDTAPELQFNARTHYQINPDTALQLEWQHVGRYFTDPENAHSYEGHDLLHVRGEHQLNNGVTLAVTINNILDTAYAERADYTTFTGDRYFPGRPRHYMVSANYTF